MSEAGKLKVSINFNRTVAVRELADGSRVEDLLREMGLYPDAHIVLRGKVPIPITEMIVPSEELRIIKVASGG